MNKQTDNKLEFLRRIYCYSFDDVKKVFTNNEHLLCKYLAYQKENSYSVNLKFILSLDLSNAEKLLKHLSLGDIDLKDKKI